MRGLMFVFFVAGLSYSCFSQTKDSLLLVLQHSSEDTNKVNTLYRLGVEYEGNQNDSALYYLALSNALAQKLSYVPGRLNYMTLYATILFQQNKQDTAIAIEQQAIAIGEKSNHPKELATIYNDMAQMDERRGDDSEALDYFLKASGLYEKLADSVGLADVNGNISYVYTTLKEYPTAYSYALNAVSTARLLHTKDASYSLCQDLADLSIVLMVLKRYDSAITVLQQAKDLSIRLSYAIFTVNAINNLCEAYKKTNRFDLLKNEAEEEIRLCKQIDDASEMTYGWGSLGAYFVYRKNYDSARFYYNQVLAAGQKSKVPEFLQSAYDGLGVIAAAQGNLAEYYRYKDLQDSVDEAVTNDKVLKNTQELEAKYSLNKKQAEIDDLTKQQKTEQLVLRQRNIIDWSIVALVIVVGLLGLLYYNNNRQKKKLQQQRINELETEKQLLAAQAVLQGQIDERGRLAKDLHDGLGGILSSTKYSFNNMRQNLIISPENADAFEKSMAMLDKSIAELRRVAHNMMPEALMEFGLDTALKDYCNNISQSGAVQITYQSFNMDEGSISKNVSPSIYRIVQELVNNILKHSGATTALVQFVRNGKALSITVEDNGKGFDQDILTNNTGMGYLNLQNRVAYLRGTMDVAASAGKGVSVNIEIPDVTV